MRVLKKNSDFEGCKRPNHEAQHCSMVQREHDPHVFVPAEHCVVCLRKNSEMRGRIDGFLNGFTEVSLPEIDCFDAAEGLLSFSVRRNQIYIRDYCQGLHSSADPNKRSEHQNRSFVLSAVVCNLIATPPLHLKIGFHLLVILVSSRLRLILQPNFTTHQFRSSNRIMGQFHETLSDGTRYQASAGAVARMLCVRKHHLRWRWR